MFGNQLSNAWQRALLAGAATGLVALPGCLVPISTEATITATWTVDGAPASATTCAALGVDTVQLNLYRVSSTVPYETLQAPCASGIIDSRTALGSFIASGDYQYDFVALRGSTEVGRDARTLISLLPAEHRTISTDFRSGMAFNPVGTDATAEAVWTIDGAAPTAASCNALGIAQVRIAFQNGASWFAHPALTAPCSAGRIDTRPTAVIRAGSWQMQVQALNAAGTIVGPGMIEPRNVTAGSHVLMQPTVFTSGVFMPLGSDATLNSAWQFNSIAPTLNACDAVAADRIRLSFFAPTDTALENGVTIFQQDCELGAFNSGAMRVLRSGTYLWALEILDIDGAIVNQYDSTTPLVVSTAAVTLPTVDFPFPTTLSVGTNWLTAGGASTTCAGAGVATMGYALRRGSTVIASTTTGMNVACADVLTFNDTALPALTPGTYDLIFQGFNAAGRKQWDSTAGCVATMSARGLVFLECGTTFTP